MDLTGQHFGRLSVIKAEASRVTASGRTEGWSLCRCQCGRLVSVANGHLKSGHTKSCGCLRKETAQRTRRKHGHAKKGGASATYTTWSRMIGRCCNPKNKSYALYGARGITVCSAWRSSFSSFLRDMGRKPIGMSIDRINNNGSYCPDNCRWATPKEQARNRRTRRLIKFRGQTKCLAEWCEVLKLNPKTVASRLNQYHWSIERTFTESVREERT